MNENPTASDWAASRGDKWLSQLHHMEAMIAAVDQPLLDHLKLDSPLRIAEVGCGGGGTTLEILRRAPAGSVVHGFDISPALIEAAKARIWPAPRSGGSAIQFDLADMSVAAPPGRPYDRLVSRFGVMFFSDPQAAFTNLARWLAADGRFAFAVWGPPAENLWMTVVRQVVAEIIPMPPTDVEAPGPFRYGDAAKLLALLDHAGFTNLAVDDWRGTLPMGGGLAPAEAANFALSAFSAVAEQIAAAGDDAAKTARERLTARFAEYLHNGTVQMEACVHIVTGSARS